MLSIPCCKVYIRPNKVKKSFWSTCLINFLSSEDTQTDRQIITKRQYDKKYIHIQTVMLLNICITSIDVKLSKNQALHEYCTHVSKLKHY